MPLLYLLEGARAFDKYEKPLFLAFSGLFHVNSHNILSFFFHQGWKRKRGNIKKEKKEKKEEKNKNKRKNENERKKKIET